MTDHHPASDGDGLSDGRFRQSIPRNVIRTFACRYGDEPVFAARLSSGIAANPYLRFFVTARESGQLTFEWSDDNGVRGSDSAAVTVV